MTQYSIDLANKQVFYLGISLIIASITPIPLGNIFIYIYFITLPFIYLSIVYPQRWYFRLIGFLAQYAIVWGLLLWILINPWCRFFYYQYRVATPNNE